jgi:hypothetical protein
MNQLGRCIIGLKRSPSTQYGHRTIGSSILALPRCRSVRQFDPVGVLSVALVLLR